MQKRKTEPEILIKSGAADRCQLRCYFACGKYD